MRPLLSVCAISGGHRPFAYDDPTYAELEALFVKYGVAVYFAGHSHSYSRYEASDNEGVVHITGRASVLDAAVLLWAINQN